MTEAKQDKIKEVEYNHGDSTVVISKEVIATIASLAAAEVKGVYDIGTDTLRSMVSKKSQKGIKVEFEEEQLVLYVEVNLLYGYNIPETSQKIQEKVRQAVENMTGLNVLAVHVRISSISGNN